MVFKALFSTSLALLPIAITFGVYFSIEHQNIIDVINGKIPPGATPTNGAGGPGSPGVPPVVAGTNTYCQLQYGAEPYPGKYLCECFSFPDQATCRLRLNHCLFQTWPDLHAPSTDISTSYLSKQAGPGKFAREATLPTEPTGS